MEHQTEPPQSQEELLQTNRRRLRLLEQQAAHFGARADPALLMEIEDLRRNIAQLERSLGVNPQSPQNGTHPRPTRTPIVVGTSPWWSPRRRLAATLGSGIALLAILLAAWAQISRGNTAL